MKVTPINEGIAIKLIENEEQEDSSIIIPEEIKKKEPQIGEVYSFGRGCNVDEYEINEGDKVLFDKFAGTELEIDGEEFRVVNITDIEAIIK